MVTARANFPRHNDILPRSFIACSRRSSLKTLYLAQFRKRLKVSPICQTITLLDQKISSSCAFSGHLRWPNCNILPDRMRHSSFLKCPRISIHLKAERFGLAGYAMTTCPPGMPKQAPFALVLRGLDIQGCITTKLVYLQWHNIRRFQLVSLPALQNNRSNQLFHPTLQIQRL
jgi:hypothetical protein